MWVGVGRVDDLASEIVEASPIFVKEQRKTRDSDVGVLPEMPELCSLLRLYCVA